MRLSEAIRLGSLAIQEPTRGRLYGCVLGMGMRACGYVPRKVYLHAFDSVGQDNHGDLVTIWSWLGISRLAYTEELYDYRSLYWMSVADLFDNNVCKGLMTLEALCDQVRAWEDELAAKGINVEQVTMAAELSQPACPIQSIEEPPPVYWDNPDESPVLEQDVAK